jgi:hypothetical protein
MLFSFVLFKRKWTRPVVDFGLQESGTQFDMRISYGQKGE